MAECKTCRWFEYFHDIHPELYHEPTQWGDCENENIFGDGNSEIEIKIEANQCDSFAINDSFGCIFHEPKQKRGRPKKNESIDNNSSNST